MLFPERFASLILFLVLSELESGFMRSFTHRIPFGQSLLLSSVMAYEEVRLFFHQLNERLIFARKRRRVTASLLRSLSLEAHAFFEDSSVRSLRESYARFHTIFAERAKEIGDFSSFDQIELFLKLVVLEDADDHSLFTAQDVELFSFVDLATILFSPDSLSSVAWLVVYERMRDVFDSGFLLPSSVLFSDDAIDY